MQVATFALAVQSSGSSLKDTPLSKVMSMPGSVSKRRRSTVTDQEAEEVVVLYDGSLRVMLGHASSRCLIRARWLVTSIVWPSTDAPMVTRTLFLLQMCSRDVESVISTSPLAGTSHSHPVFWAVHLSVVSVIVVPMLDTAVIKKVASELLLLESFGYQFPMWVSGTLFASITSTSKLEVSTDGALVSE